MYVMYILLLNTVPEICFSELCIWGLLGVHGEVVCEIGVGVIGGVVGWLLEGLLMLVWLLGWCWCGYLGVAGDGIVVICWVSVAICEAVCEDGVGLVGW